MSVTATRSPRRRRCAPAVGPPRIRHVPPHEPFALPTDLTDEQALAVFELIDELRELICTIYERRCSTPIETAARPCRHRTTLTRSRRFAVLTTETGAHGARAAPHLALLNRHYIVGYAQVDVVANSFLEKPAVHAWPLVPAKSRWRPRVHFGVLRASEGIASRPIGPATNA